jgi:hypothetical protein
MDSVRLVGPDWAAWRAILRAAFCLPLSADELLTYQKLTGRDTVPLTLILELWLCCGRRAGKSTIAALLAFFKGITADPTLFAKKDELIVIPVIAADRKQSRVLLGHLRSFARTPALMKYVSRADLTDRIELANGITIEIQTASSKSTRGYTSPCVTADELAFWPTEGADPAEEILEALRPTMGTVPNPLLLALSNPHEPRGPLFEIVDKYYARDNNDGVLVVVADTCSLHPSFSRAVVKRAFTRDAVKAASEYGDPDTGKIQCRQGSSALFDQAPVDASVVAGRRQLPPAEGIRYFGFLDAAQGSRSGDSMTLAIGHQQDGVAVIDYVLERRPPFSPVDVLTRDFAPVLQRYGIRGVVGDNVSRGFVEATLRALGISFDVSTLDKSALYLNLLNLINSSGCELLDDPTLRLQLLSLQRYAVSGGKDRVDHPKGRPYHDDVCNSVAGVVALVSGVGAKQGIPALFSFGDLLTPCGKSSSLQGQLAALAKATLASLDAEDERTRRLNEVYEHQPMTSPAVWHIHSTQ